jgi:hypothetical protein
MKEEIIVKEIKRSTKQVEPSTFSKENCKSVIRNHKASQNPQQRIAPETAVHWEINFPKITKQVMYKRLITIMRSYF